MNVERANQLQVDVEANVGRYLGDRSPDSRYSSFDYCFNYFRDFVAAGSLPELIAPARLQISCLQLGFYLASWGMLRGSSPLLQRSVRSLAPTVEKLAGAPADLWTLDVDQYTESNIRRVLNFASELRSTLHASASDILVTKIMLGTLGCVPAFDNNFKKGLGVSTFGPKSLRLVSRFYEDNRARIDELRVPTLDFMDGHETRHLYTRAKVIDMVFFIAGS